MKRLFLMAMFWFPLLCRADPLITIYDSGETLSIDRYTRRTPKPDTSLRLDQIKLPELPIVFPISTPVMRPGKVTPTAFSIPHLQIPLFLIGSDDFSRLWLRQRRSELKQVGAVGLLVDADSKETMMAMMTLAQGLRLIPVSATDIAQALGVRYYPILISKTGWEQ